MDPGHPALLLDAGAGDRHFGELSDRRPADQIVGSLLPTGGLSAISYADRLYQLPGGVIVIATGSVLLREMSALVALGDERTRSPPRTAPPR